MARPDSKLPPSVRLDTARRAERLAEAQNLARHYVLAAAGLALVPWPLADLVAAMALQVKLVHGLAGLYGVPFKLKAARSLLASLLSGMSAALAGRALASLAKAVPGLGALAGGGGLSASLAGVTYVTGQVFIRHFEAGGSLSDLDAQAVRALPRRELESRESPAGTPVEASVETAAPDVPPGGSNPLEEVRGIGPVYANRLRAAGVADLAGLAALSPDEVRGIIGRRVSADAARDWIAQAAALARRRPEPAERT